MAKRFRILRRREDATEYRRVDEEGTASLIVYTDPDVAPYRSMLAGLDVDAIAEEWKAASPGFNGWQVPDDAGQKRWTNLEPVVEPEPVSAAPTPPPKPAPKSVAPDVERTARVLAIEVHKSRVARRAQLFPNGVPPDAEVWIGYAKSQGWMVEDTDGLLRAGHESPYLPDPIAETPAGSDLGWSHRFLSRRG